MAPDSYIVDKSRRKSSKKRLSARNTCLCGKAAPTTKILSLSPNLKLWYKKQKLDDRYIIGLFRQCLTLEDNFKKKMEVSWEFEAGKLFIIDLDITKSENVEDNSPVEFLPSRRIYSDFLKSKRNQWRNTSKKLARSEKI